VTWDWSRLLARSAEGRQAIFDERFLGRWDDLMATVDGIGIFDFTEHEASQLLTVFAVNWEHLPQTRADPEARYHLVVFNVAGNTDHVAVSFVARPLRPDQIVVTHPLIVRRF
jgi:hypothetical protein